jgi:hypothetical protein
MRILVAHHPVVEVGSLDVQLGLDPDGRTARQVQAAIGSADPGMCCARVASTWNTKLAARVGVDRPLQAARRDATLGKSGDGVDQVGQRPAEPVELPDHQGVAGAQLVQQLLEGGPVAVGAAGGIGEHPVAAGALQASTCRCGCWSTVEARA